MIQRVQSLWLLLASVFTFLTLKFPFYTVALPLENSKYYEINGTENILLMLFTIALGLLSFISIFLYKTRAIQFRLCIVAILVDVLLFFLYLKSLSGFSDKSPSISFFLNILVIPILIFAAKGIRNDEKLIKESDRLR